MAAMSEKAMVDTVKVLSGDSSDYVETYLDMAKGAVAARCFPFANDPQWDDVPAKYHQRTCEIAAYMVCKRGAEGQTQHIESDVSRIYGSAYIPEDMLSAIMPFVGVPK